MICHTVRQSETTSATSYISSTWSTSRDFAEAKHTGASLQRTGQRTENDKRLKQAASSRVKKLSHCVVAAWDHLQESLPTDSNVQLVHLYPNMVLICPNVLTSCSKNQHSNDQNAHTEHHNGYVRHLETVSRHMFSPASLFQQTTAQKFVIISIQHL